MKRIWQFLAVGLILLFCAAPAIAQGLERLADSLIYRVELQATASSGDHSPLWLSANRYGLSSTKCNYGYLRGAIGRPVEADSTRRWGLGYMADVALATGMTSTLVVQQAFVEARWLKGTLTVGSKEQPMELKNPLLSTGSQTFGINARPVPQVRLALPDYWTVPGTRQWLALKGHVAYGMTTDDSWQKDFAADGSRYTEHVLYHSKAGYIRIGPRNITLEAGLELGSMFGGTSYNVFAPGSVTKNKKNLRAFADAFFMGGTDTGEAGVTGVYENVAGNHVGSWVARLNFDYPRWNLGLYADHFFEDQSSMFFLDYDGYGTGAEWDAHKDHRYFRYDLKDIMLGMELKLKHWPWVDNVVVEYLYTKYQSGPVYHDHSQNISTHISGQDNYYNHNIYTGWQHWGQVMGNPLYRSPLYNESGVIRVENNRFVAWHVGLSGEPLHRLRYRVLATTQRGYGTYSGLYPDPRDHFSLLGELSYGLPRGGWSVKGAFGLDSGDIYGDQVGFQLTVAKAGVFGKK
jgi:hypothetical protein